MQKLDDYILTADGALSVQTCQQLIAVFQDHASHQRRNGAGVRAGLEHSAWTELDLGRSKASALLADLKGHAREVHAAYSAALGLHLEVPQPARFAEWIIKRYRPGGSEAFQPHYDAVHAVSNRYLTYLWYLNDVEEGGETEFVDIGYRVAPRAGRLLMFPPYWMFQHAGLPPRSGDKYILSTYALF